MRWEYKNKFSKVVLLCLLAVITGAFVCMIWVCSFSVAAGSVVINEVCSNNFSAVCDEKGEYYDYIELYNPSASEISMNGFYLSDDEKVLAKRSLNGVMIPAKGYALIWLDGTGEGGSSEDSADSDSQSSFGISREGDTVYLSDSEGNIADSIEVPALSYNTSYARCADGEREWAQMSVTAGASNNNGEKKNIVELEDPVFSMESGCYDTSFDLSIAAAEGEEIYYTLDGSKPDKDALLYEGPLDITDVSGGENVYAARTDLSPTNSYTPDFAVDKATIIRAVSYAPQKDVYSNIVTKVYFVGFDEKTEYEDLAVISIVSDPESLFDEDNGMYGNGKALEEYKEAGGLVDGELLSSFTDAEGNQRHLYMASNAFKEGKEWEREAFFSYFDEEHFWCFSQNVGVRVAGQSTRGASQKSLNIFGRDIYDENVTFPYEFFADTSYSTIKLRNGGSDNAESKIKDAFLESLAEGRAVAVQHSKPCVVFLNGEYWGIYNLRERYKEEYLENYYDVNKNNVWIIDSGNGNVGGEDAKNAYDQMVEWISAVDMSVEENYQAVCELIDVQSLIDYYCINLYVDNQDMSFGQNMALWRTIGAEDSEYGDCKWRWMLFDMDISMNQYDSNTFAFSPRRDGQDLMDEPVIKSLMQNTGFREQFYNTFLEIANTAFAYDRVHERLMEWQETYEKQVVKSHQRFFSEDFGEETFEAYIEQMDDFFKNRYPFIVECLEEELGMIDANQNAEGE